MSGRAIVHVIGTGTIGEPLTGLLVDFKDELGNAMILILESRSDVAKSCAHLGNAG